MRNSGARSVLCGPIRSVPWNDPIRSVPGSRGSGPLKVEDAGQCPARPASRDRKSRDHRPVGPLLLVT
ncbi:hypothetical protein B0T26DRAFT_720714, partial [Lasiosphaeria miniovina]